MKALQRPAPPRELNSRSWPKEGILAWTKKFALKGCPCNFGGLFVVYPCLPGSKEKDAGSSLFCFDSRNELTLWVFVAETEGFECGWSAWSQWTPCDRVCDGGNSWRERACMGAHSGGVCKNCVGHAREARECNTHSCQGQRFFLLTP